MKTVVFGLFDASDDARRVLDQLASSPLDLETVSVVHQDPAVQEALAAEAGLPRRRSLVTGLAIGGLAGAALGAVLGSGALAVLGPLLATGLGAVVGSILGALVAVVLDAPKVPDLLTKELVAALANGKTVISVRTGNMATARAIRDLFEAGGSGLLGPPPVPPGDSLRVEEVSLEPSIGGMRPGAPRHDEEHAIFAPPWRRTPFAAGPRRGATLEEVPDFPDDDVTTPPDRG